MTGPKPGDRFKIGDRTFEWIASEVEEVRPIEWEDEDGTTQRKAMRVMRYRKVVEKAE